MNQNSRSQFSYLHNLEIMKHYTSHNNVANFLRFNWYSRIKNAPPAFQQTEGDKHHADSQELDTLHPKNFGLHHTNLGVI
ncbi:hypothetical protein R1flu_012149 [Riccia fluitans]|uniref:Uncharacterized protein n=1 Tax=Riccia fluitans TaxID=41844 RepID=A0ABD1Z9T1_9MARC